MGNEHNLQQDLDLLNFHINNSPLAFIEWDKNFRVKTWSDKARQLFGYTEKDVIGLNPLALNFLDTETRMRIRQKMNELLQGKRSSNKVETYIRTKFGKFLHIELYNSAMLDDAGKLVSAVSFVQDVTLRRKTEQRIRKNEALLSQLFANSPIAIVRLNKKNYIEDVNQSFEQLFGYTLEEAKGKNIDHLIVPEYLKEQATNISTNTHAGEPNQAEAIRIHKNGHEIPVLLAGVPVKIGAKTIAIYGMYVDITERKQAEAEVRKSLKEKEILLSEIHHRVKNNLALISGLLELQTFNTEREEVKDALQYSQSRIMSMAMVHERLYQSDTLSELNCQMFIKKLAKSISETHYNESKNIQVDLDIDYFELNVTQAIPLGLILNELLVNAYKHAFWQMPKGIVSVMLKKDEDTITLNVSDNGKGYPDDLEPEDTQGLGMTLISTLTKQLKGDLCMNNSEGSTFEVKFKME